MAEMKIYQDVDLSLTENLIPTVVPVKQFDHKARKIRCVLYKDSVEYTIPEGVIVNCAGTRPDGHLFQYSSEIVPELVSVVDNAVVFTITDFMTEVFGRFPVDVILLESDGSVLGSFSLTLRVERAATGNGKIAVITYAKAVEAVEAGIYELHHRGRLFRIQVQRRPRLYARFCVQHHRQAPRDHPEHDHHGQRLSGL